MDIGQRVKALRVAQGKSQNALAHAAGMSQGRLSEIENNVADPVLSTLQKIAAALGVNTATLVADDSPGDFSPDSWAWFWRARMAAIKPDDIAAMRNADVRGRVVWCLDQLVSAFSTPSVAARLQTTETNVTNLLAGKDAVTEWLLGQLTNQGQIPSEFLLHGDPPPTDDQLRRLLAHPEASAYLAVVIRAIDSRILPEILERQLDIMLSMLSNNKPLAK